jgi:hypothetical protein
MNAARHSWRAWLAALLVTAAVFSCAAQTTNGVALSTNTAAQSANVTAQPTSVTGPSTSTPPTTASAPPRVESAAQGPDESAFRIIAERNIFDANRSGGTVRLSSRRPSVVDSFTLVGTMAYDKGAFAFFEGSRSDFTKVLKPAGIIAGHKLVDVYANSVKLDVDGKEIELPVGSQMRREDEGMWQVADAQGGDYSAAPSGNGDSSSRYSRSDRGRDYPRSRRGESSESRNASPALTSSPNVNQDEVLKRLMQRREQESQ